MNPFNSHVPGMQSEVTYHDRVIAYHVDTHDRISITLAPNTGDLLSGTILGFSTADNFARPVTRTTTLAVAVDADGVDQVVGVTPGTASLFKVGQTVSVVKADGTGGVQDLGTITSIIGDNITTSQPLVTDLAEGDHLFVSDGSETALLILADSVPDAAQVRVATAYVGGKFFGSKLIGLDSIALADLKARVVPFGTDDDDVPENLVIV